MDNDDKPMSIKDRIAKFQGIINNSPSTSPTYKPSSHKQSPPQKSTPPQTISPPASTNSTKQQGHVESPSIVKPSAAKQTWQLNPQSTQNDVPKKSIQPPVIKEPEPKKHVEIETPDIVKPSVARQTWQPATQPYAQNVNFLKILQAANKQSGPAPEIAKQGSPTITKPAENKGNEEGGSLSTAAIRQMLEGKMANVNRQSVPVQPKTVIPKGQNQNSSKQIPIVAVKTEVGAVKGNTQKLNQFFENQKQHQRIKAEEQRRRKAEDNELKPGNISPVKKQEFVRPMSVVPTYTSTSPGLSLPSPGLAQHNSLMPGQSPELTLMSRLKRKKKTKERFSSDDD